MTDEKFGTLYSQNFWEMGKNFARDSTFFGNSTSLKKAKVSAGTAAIHDQVLSGLFDTTT